MSLELSAVLQIDKKHLLVTACVIGADRYLSTFWFVISAKQELFDEHAKELILSKLESIGLDTEYKYHQDYEAHCSPSARGVALDETEPSYQSSCSSYPSSLSNEDMALVSFIQF